MPTKTLRIHFVTPSLLAISSSQNPTYDPSNSVDSLGRGPTPSTCNVSRIPALRHEDFFLRQTDPPMRLKIRRDESLTNPNGQWPTNQLSVPLSMTHYQLLVDHHRSSPRQQFLLLSWNASDHVNSLRRATQSRTRTRRLQRYDLPHLLILQSPCLIHLRHDCSIEMTAESARIESTMQCLKSYKNICETCSQACLT